MFRRKRKDDLDNTGKLDIDSIVTDNEVVEDDMEFDNINDVILEENSIEHSEEEISVGNNEEELVLYIVVDKNIPGLIQYMRGCKLNVTDIMYNITDARNSMLMQSKNTRMAIIETGTGLFMSTKVRQELIDLLGLADRDSRITVFYTNEVIKADAIKALGKGSKHIDWIEYTNTISTVAELISLRENYVLDKNSVINAKTKEELEGYIGINNGEQLSKQIEITGLSGEAILNNVINAGESIQQYEPNV